MSDFIPLSIPNFEGNEKKYVDDAVEKGWVSTGGTYINKFENQLAEFLNVSQVCACQSGTAAIHLSLIEAGVGPGDIVLVPALTFIATVNPVKYQFATPIFMDYDDSLCIDPVKLRNFCEQECIYNNGLLIYNQKRVKAIIVVHVFGNMADMESIMKIAEDYNLIVIEDATEALGTFYKEGKYSGKYAGTIGHFGTYSFNGNKIITTGGGGALVSKKKKKTQHIRYLSTQAKDDTKYYTHNEVGYNYRMTNVQAAIGVAQMEELSEFIHRKIVNYNLYQHEFEGYKLAELLPFRNGTESNKWFYSLKIDICNVKYSMKEIINRLDNIGIQTRAIWGLINLQKPYENEITYKLEKALYYSNCILNIPSSTQITKNEIKYVADQIKRVLS